MKKLFVCVLALSMVFAFTAPTMATDWDFYGNFQFDTFSVDVDKDLSATGFSDRDTRWQSNGISRFGGKVTKGDIFGNVEFNDGGNIRHLYGEWNFGAGKLLIGQTWDLSFQGGSLDNYAGGFSKAFGASGTRDNMLRLTFGGLQIGALTPTVYAAGYGGGNDVDTTMPKMEVKYTFATDMFTIQPYLGYNSVSYGTNVATDDTTDLTSIVYALMAKVNLGAFYINGRIWGGTNTGDFGFDTVGSATKWIDTNANIDGTTNKFADNTAMCYGAVVGFKLSDSITLEGMYTKLNSEDEARTGVTKTEYDGTDMYLLAQIMLAPGVELYPEFAVHDFGETKVSGGATTDNGSATAFGATWIIRF